MKSRSANPARLTAVDEDARARPPEVLESRRYDPLAEERWLRDQFRRERSAAYWFAASKWGFAGLLIGIFIGAFVMFIASSASLPLLTDAMNSAQALEAARQAAEAGYQTAPPRPSAP